MKTTLTATLPSATASTASLAERFQAWRDCRRQAKEVARTLRYLDELEDHLLEDIGLCRQDIERAVRTGRV